MVLPSIGVAGCTRKPVPLSPDTDLAKTVDGVLVTLRLQSKLRAEADIPLNLSLNVNDLGPYLGAADRETFIHAHPLEAAALADSPVAHVHTAPIAGPSPSTIGTITGFRNAGIYKLSFQFQRHSEVSTVSWVVRVLPSDRSTPPATDPRKNAIAVQVSSVGFTPSRLVLPANRATRVAFTRLDAQSCAQKVVLPELGIRRKLPPGQTVIVDIGVYGRITVTQGPLLTACKLVQRYNVSSATASPPRPESFIRVRSNTAPETHATIKRRPEWGNDSGDLTRSFRRRKETPEWN